MKIVISGSNGLVGGALIPPLANSGHEILRLVRHESQLAKGALFWNPDEKTIDASQLEGVDAIIHLAGENIAKARWTEEQKKRIRDSRVHGTQLLSQTVASLERPPRVFLSASGIHFYGHREKERLTEESPSGQGFLPDICRRWEAATEPAAAKGIRVVLMRFAMILSAKGGALPKLLTPFKLGLGGPAGPGGQYWSWIALDDVIGAIQHLLLTPELSGPVNFASPSPVTNREFARTLGRVLHRPTLLPLPRFAARLGLGEMAGELLFASMRVEPAKLLASNYRFQFPDLENALRRVLQPAAP